VIMSDQNERAAPVGEEDALPTATQGNEQDTLAVEIRQLSALDLDGLRCRWRKETRRTAPAHLPKSLLLRMLAYRIQAAALGDLDPETKRALRQFARERNRDAADKGNPGRRHRPRVLKPGTVLVREWEGHLHRVTVLNRGYAWNGETHSSLSAVALAITGTSWSGPRFFGLIERKAGQRQGRHAVAADKAS
jgi:Protein of unknown function (DUF2924)